MSTLQDRNIIEDPITGRFHVTEGRVAFDIDPSLINDLTKLLINKPRAIIIYWYFDLSKEDQKKIFWTILK